MSGIRTLQLLLHHHEHESITAKGRSKIIHLLRIQEIQDRLAQIILAPSEPETIERTRQAIAKFVKDPEYLGKLQHKLEKYDDEADTDPMINPLLHEEI